MPSVYDYRHIELDRVGTGKKRIGPHHHGDTASRIFGTGSTPSPPVTPSRRLSNDSIVSMSPGRLIKQRHQQSNVFPTENDSIGSTRPSSSASSVCGDHSSDIHPSPSPAVVMTPGKLIKQQHTRSKIFPTAEDRSPPSSSSASSISDPVELHPVVMSPGRIIKKQHMSSNIFAVDTKRNSNGLNGMNGTHNTSPASSTDAVSESGINDSLLI